MNESKPKTLQERFEKVKTMKEAELDAKKIDYFFNSFDKRLCPRKEYCPQCVAYGSSCGGCDHSRCLAKSCGLWCYYQNPPKLNMCGNKYDRCGKMNQGYIDSDLEDLGAFDLEAVMGAVKPTKPLNLDTPFIPGVAPYGRNAPGEITRHEEAFIDLSYTDNICMVPSNQLPLYFPKEDGRFADPHKIGIRKVDLLKYLGINENGRIFLNFRMKDFLLDYWWRKITYDRDNSPYQTMFKALKDLGIEYTVNINFSMWDHLPKYHGYYNMQRSWMSIVWLQKYFDDVVLEFDHNPFVPEINQWYFRMIEEAGISTIHLNAQLEAKGENIYQLPLRQKFVQNLHCEEIILGGVSSMKVLMKFKEIMRDKRIYTSHTRAYIGTVFNEHLSGRRWNKKKPSGENELDVALYYKELFEENSRWFTDKVTELGF